MRSLSARLFFVWALSLASACAVGFLLLQLYQQSASAQIGRADAAAGRACEQIADRYAYYSSGWAAPADAVTDAAVRRDLAAVAELALTGSPGIEGGIWHADAGSLAYAFPTYAGTRPKTDLPAVERPRIAALAEVVAQSGQPQSEQTAAGTQALLLHVCPLRGPIAGLTAWTVTRVTEAAGWDELRAGLAVLLGVVLALSGLLTWLVLTWRGHVGRIEAALSGTAEEDLPYLPPTGEAELDRIVAALNLAGVRLAEARRRSEDLSARVATAERLAALGRVAAGVAHEIRNPIAAMRLKAENALAGDDARRSTALTAILAQIARLDALIGELLAMTQRRQPQPEATDVTALLATAAADHGAVAVEAPASLLATLDPALLRRTLDALLDNAVRHTADGGRVTLRAATAGGNIRIEIADTGPGVPVALQAVLFEPFVTGRADGTGLGLAIARELAEAQGGRLRLTHAGGAAPGDGAVFALELPCRPS